jgi:hydrogenase maturation protein HypF
MGIADLFLVHDRPIEIRCDDSVVRHICDRTVTIRRSRGYVPESINVPFEFPEPILASGAHLKNTFCLGMKDQAILSPHIGDLEDYQTLRSFEAGITCVRRLGNPGGPVSAAGAAV